MKTLITTDLNIIIEYLIHFINFCFNKFIFFCNDTIILFVFMKIKINMSQFTTKFNRFIAYNALP